MHVKTDGDEIVCTREHPFYVPVRGWTAACDLRAGDILVRSNGEYVVVEAIEHELLESPITVYNFEVEDFHTYYVGDTSVLVHNMCAKKADIKQVEAAAKKLKLDRDARWEFGDYVEELKKGIPNNKNFSFKELLEIGRAFLEK